MKFFPLHVHSHYSLLDGLSKPMDIANRCEELGVEGSALTDHGTIAGSVAFVKAMQKKNKKAILGCELYICKEEPTKKESRELSHLVVLAKNKNGWLNLVAATSLSNSPEYFYYKPRIDLKNLSQFCDGSLVGFSGHLGSDLANCIFTEPKLAYRASSYDQAKSLADPDWITKTTQMAIAYEEMFGKGNFFIEIQLIDQNNMPAAKLVADGLRYISKKTGIPCVATPDAHYARREDAYDQRVILCNNLDTTLPKIQKSLEQNGNAPLESFFKSDSYHIPSPEEMYAIHTEEEVLNTQVIADMCEDYSITRAPMLPQFPTPNQMDSEEYLRQLCRQGWNDRLSKVEDVLKRMPNHTKEEYGERVKKELEILTEAGLADYFLIVRDIVDAAKKRGEIVGAGRGSAAGSLVLYLLGVTDIDPIEYDLIFERFYNAGRNTEEHTSLPDVDMDFEKESRENTIQYIKERYGEDKVAQIMTFSRMQGRSALNDVLRAHSACSFEEMNRITEWIPDEADISDQLEEMRQSSPDGEASIIQWALENNEKELRPWCYIDDKGQMQGNLARRFEQAIRLEGTKRSQSKHAAGIVISQEPLDKVCPMLYDKKSGEMIAGMEMGDLESMGHVKFDILGIAMLDKIHGVQNLVTTGELNGQ